MWCGVERAGNGPLLVVLGGKGKKMCSYSSLYMVTNTGVEGGTRYGGTRHPCTCVSSKPAAVPTCRCELNKLAWVGHAGGGVCVGAGVVVVVVGSVW